MCTRRGQDLADPLLSHSLDAGLPDFVSNTASRRIFCQDLAKGRGCVELLHRGTGCQENASNTLSRKSDFVSDKHQIATSQQIRHNFGTYLHQSTLVIAVELPHLRNNAVVVVRLRKADHTTGDATD